MVVLTVLGASAYFVVIDGDTREQASWLSILSGEALSSAQAAGRTIDTGASPRGTSPTGDDPIVPSEVGPDGVVIGSEPPAITTSADLEAFLLRGSDLPPGWVTVTSSSDDLGGACLGALPTNSPRTEGRIVLRYGQAGPALSNTVAEYVDEPAAVAELQVVQAALASCLDQEPAGGQPVVSALTIESEADAVIGVSLTYTQGDEVVRGELLVARVGHRLATVLMVAIDERELAVGRDALGIVVERMRDD